VATIACHRVWKTKKNAANLKLVNKLINEAKKDDKDIETKKTATKKKAAEKRKTKPELMKAGVTMVSAAAMASETPIDLTE
jgi:hypothetical protein